MNKDIKSHYVVTGLFGNDSDFGIYRAPVVPGVECLFFSNSDVIGAYARKQGWRYIKTMHPVLENDYLESSLQSKWVKYLQFLFEGPIIEENLEVPESILYFDHKFHVTSEHVAEILARPSDASVLIRKTPVAKESINVEIDAAMPYERYARHMEPTKAFVRAHLAKGAKSDVTICNTGLIHYRNLEIARDLANRVYTTCQSLKQPECQIVWAVHAQAFGDKIEVIDWNDPLVGDIEWQDPKLCPAGYLSKEAPKRRVAGHGIVVAGFHRSGTSSVAGMLHSAGISAGTDLMDGNEDNSKGYFESWGLVNMHDRLMASKGVDWATSLDQEAALNDADLGDLRAYFDQRAEAADGAWCMKDPRIGRYMFEWKRTAPELKTLLLYRSPNASARSLLKRSLREFVQTRGTLELPRRFYEDPDFALRLWVEHNEIYVRFCQAHPDDCLVIGHAAIVNDFNVLAAVSTRFGIDMPGTVSGGFFDRTLLSEPRPVYVVSPALRARAIAVWNALSALAISEGDPSAAAQDIQEQLICDPEGKLARAQMLEMFAKAALRELDERHEVAKSTFWRMNKVQAECNTLKAEVGRLKQESDRLRNARAQLKAQGDQLKSANDQVKAMEIQNLLLQFKANNAKRQGSAFTSYRDRAALRRSHLFNASWYIERNPDVKAGGINPLQHYIEFGASEGRDPSPTFSTVRYLSLYEDVLKGGMNPLLHYAKFGQKEGRSL